MPKRRSRENVLEEALEALTRALDRFRASWMILGGIAVVARGVRRFTTDIDAVVRAEGIDLTALVEMFDEHEIVPRIECAVEFARVNLVLLLEHQPTGVELDVSLAWSSFENAAIASASVCRFGRVRAPMASAQDLLVFKAIAGRAKDIEDIETLLALDPSLDPARAREVLEPLAELAEAPELVLAFDAAVARARPSASRTLQRMTRKRFRRRNRSRAG
jgi:hypothetical protein